MLNLQGGISPENTKKYIKNHKFESYCGAGVEFRQHLRGGVSLERPEMYILIQTSFFCGYRVKV